MDQSRDTRPPSVVIVIELEAAPRIYTISGGEEGASRLRDWVQTHEDLAEIVDLAVESDEAWRRRAAREEA